MMVLKLGTQGYICLESWNTVKMNAVLLSYKIRGIAPHPPPFAMPLHTCQYYVSHHRTEARDL